MISLSNTRTLPSTSVAVMRRVYDSLTAVEALAFLIPVLGPIDPRTDERSGAYKYKGMLESSPIIIFRLLLSVGTI